MANDLTPMEAVIVEVATRRHVHKEEGVLVGHFSADRKKAAQQREMALAHFPDQAIEVTTGVRPAAEFTRSITSLVQGGALSEAEGNDFLRAAGLL